jgi:aspartyl-tRNA(Asn)/glutamyl-tRNA(Gln) amidotransferase subunit A
MSADPQRFADDLVATLLAAQGLEVPEGDLREVGDTVRDMLDHAVAWERHEPFGHEPWSPSTLWERGLARDGKPPHPAPGAPVAAARDHDAVAPTSVAAARPAAGAPCAGRTDPRHLAAIDLAFADAHDQAVWLRAGRSSVELAGTYLERIARLDGQLRAFITVTGDRALEAAARADAELRAGRARSPLHGLPFAVKDQMLIEGVRVTGGSRVLRDVIGERTATVVARLEDAGAVFLGTLNTHEVHAGPTREFPFGVARNPWDTERSPGASSSGPASAVAAGLCSFSLGGDTGGSIRGPAAFCGLVGLKPTWGRVSRDGVIPLAVTLDCVGPLTRSTRDSAVILRAIAGADARDATASHAPVDDYASRLGAADLRGVRVGVIGEMMDEAGVSADALAATRTALDALRELGAITTTVSLPLLPIAQQVCTALVLVEAASHHRRSLREHYLDFDVNTRVGFLAGAIAPGIVAAHAARMRTAVAEQLEGLLEQVDVLAGPSADAANRLDEPLRRGPRRGPGGPATPLPQAYNLAGVPALSVPCGYDPDGLPLGLQLAARHFDEATLLRVADAYERATPWRERRPDLG